MENADQQTAYYAVIPNPVLRDDNLRPNAKLLYAQISVMCNRYGYCCASNAFFAELLKLTERAIRNLISQLEEHGYVYIEYLQRGNSEQEQIRHIYVSLDVLEVLKSGRNFPALRNKFSSAAEQIFRSYNVDNYIYNNPPIPPKGSDGKKSRRREPLPDFEPDRFERFWDYYKSITPKGKRIGSKQDARVAWNKIRPDKSLRRQFFVALKAQSSTGDWERGIGIKYVSTWLNGHYWEDAGETGTAEKPQPEVAAPEAAGAEEYF